MNIEKRNSAFARRCTEVYEQCARSGRRPSLEEVVVRALATAPECFYVDPVYAYNKILRIYKHGAGSLPSTVAGCMWLELAAMVRAEQLRRGGTVSRALDYVLNFRHPSGFHMSRREGMRVAGAVFERRVEHRPRRSADVRPQKTDRP